jgi:hypothetical protein
VSGINSSLLRHLKQPDLFAALDRVASWDDQGDRGVFQVFNPSTGELLAELPDMGVEQTKAGSTGLMPRNPDGQLGRPGIVATRCGAGTS